MSWDGQNPVGLDLYYDPIVDEHVGRGPMGIIAPTWYFAPQRPDVARAGWHMTATLSGALGDGPIVGLDNPEWATMLLQFAGEFADPAMKRKIWDAADEHIDPTWDHTHGEFTLGFGLDEPHPRGQLNARAMAGWVCTPGAWSRIFNEPHLGKFAEPTVEGVDFPSVALSEARWDGVALHLAAQPQNPANSGIPTRMRLTNVATTDGWVMTRADGVSVALVGEKAGEKSAANGHVDVELVADNRPVVIRRP